MGKGIKKRREANGLSQHALAKVGQISRQHVARRKAGEPAPTIGMFQRLAKTLDVPMTELLG